MKASTLAAAAGSIKMLASPLEIERALTVPGLDCATEEELLSRYDAVDIVFMGNYQRLPPSARECAQLIGKLSSAQPLSPQDDAVIAYGQLEYFTTQLETSPLDIAMALEQIRKQAPTQLPAVPRMRR